MDVVFLDIDGVLNNANDGGKPNKAGFIEKDLAICQNNLENLKRLLEAFPDLKIVWSTNWRQCEKDIWFGWQNPCVWLERQPWMVGRVVGKTPRKLSSEHYHDIKWWLDDHPETENYVIFEDSYFPKDWFGIDKHVVRCDDEIGLTDADIALAADILRGKLA
jgi:hypothetical protein